MIKQYLKTAKQWLTSDTAVSVMLCFALVFAMGITNSFATTNQAADDFGKAICTIPEAVITGSIGRAIATIGIIIIGIMATLGRITWTQAMVVGVGISVIFGAAALAGMLAVSKGEECPGIT